MESINVYGWDRYVRDAGFAEHQSVENIGRVCAVRGNTFEVYTEMGNKRAELLGRLLYAYEKWEQPKVGDWVRFIDYDDTVLVEDVLPRVNELYRKTAGKTYEKQVMVTNIDQAVVIQGLDHDFNINRIERYLVQIVTCGIKPLVILNKSDLVEDVQQYVDQIERLQREVKVYCCSVKTGAGLEELTSEVFSPGLTSVLIGSSGVGKSSLVNALKDSVLKTREVSQATGKGRHTTTTRDMFLLENGAIIIDTPGMREFGLGYEEDADFGEQFPLISRFAEECRFNDCSHVNEEGCNVIHAVEEGELDAAVYENYLKLIREQKHFQTTTHEKKKQGKQFGKMVKEAKEYRRKYKY